MPPKSSIAQKYFLIAKFKRHLTKSEGAIDDSNILFQFDKTIVDLDKTRKDIEISTMYLVDHPTENVRVDILISDFTSSRTFENTQKTGYKQLDQLISNPRLTQENQPLLRPSEFETLSRSQFQ